MLPLEFPCCRGTGVLSLRATRNEPLPLPGRLEREWANAFQRSFLR
jgi:hypothetical protein